MSGTTKISRSYLVSIPAKDFKLNELLKSTSSLVDTINPRYFLWQNAGTPRTSGATTSFPIPELLVGTINSLMLLSDDLIKLDNACKNVVLAIERQGKELYNKQYKDVTKEQIDSWAFVDSNRSMLEYFMGFQWAEQKYPKGYPLQEMSNLIKTKVNKMEDDLKHFQQNYQEKRTLKATADRSGRGNLLVKDLSSVLEVESKQERTKGTTIVSSGQPLRCSDFLNTQFMKTLVVVVPTSASKEFEATYTTLGGPEDQDDLGTSTKESDSLLNSNETKEDPSSILDSATSLPCSPVVPGSLMKVLDDHDSILYLITVLKSQQERSAQGDIDQWTLADSFYHSCRKRRVVIRDFDVDPKVASLNRAAKSKLDSDYLHYQGKTLDWCKVHYGEAVIAWGHVKAIRVHVESVLRYGLPPEFKTVLIVPKSGKDKKLRDVLKKLYGHLDASSEDDVGGGGGGGGPMMEMQGEFYPYVNISF